MQTNVDQVSQSALLPCLFRPDETELTTSMLRVVDLQHHWMDDPTGCNWGDEHGTSHYTHYSHARLGTQATGGREPFRALILEETTAEEASNLCSLMIAGLLVFEAFLDFPVSVPFPFGEDFDEASLRLIYRSENGGPTKLFCRNSPLFGLGFALLASTDECIAYAAEKFALSIRLTHITPSSALPSRGAVFHPRSDIRTDQVITSMSIIAAYAAIEELGVEVRSSSNKERFLKPSEWNPEVRQDSLKRLANRGINGEDRFTWVVRGEDEGHKKQVKPQLGLLAPYSDSVTQDRELELLDAIHYVSYLRNFYAAHRFSEGSKHLGPYDVHNCQKLVQRLLKAAAGLDEIRPSDFPSMVVRATGRG